MSEYDMNGNVVAEIVTNRGPSPIASLVRGFVPGRNVPVADAAKVGTKSFGKWTMERIDALPSKRNNIIHVLVENPKQSGSDAYLKFAAQGVRGSNNVTVDQFIERCAAVKGKRGLIGTAGARSELTWNLERGFVTLSDLVA